MSLFSKTEDQIVAMVERGAFRFVWNLASPKARSRELRFFPPELAAMIRGQTFEGSLEDVEENLFPRAKAVLRTLDVTNALNLSNAHVFTLARNGLIPPCGGLAARAGRQRDIQARKPGKLFTSEA